MNLWAYEVSLSDCRQTCYDRHRVHGERLAGYVSQSKSFHIHTWHHMKITCICSLSSNLEKEIICFPALTFTNNHKYSLTDEQRVTVKSLSFRRMTAASLLFSWWGCWEESRPVWNIYPTWVTFIGTWRLGTFWWTATWCARSPTSGCPECLKMNQKELTPPECVYFPLYTLIHHSCVDVRYDRHTCERHTSFMRMYKQFIRKLTRNTSEDIFILKCEG